MGSTKVRDLENSAWLIKTDSLGSMLWNQTYNGSLGSFVANSVIETNDGGYLLAGGTSAYDSHDSIVNTSVFLVKTDSNGNMLWNQTNEELREVAWSVIQTSDGGYALACGQYPSLSFGSLVKTDSDGKQQWSIACNTTVCSVVQTSDGEYVFAGSNSRASDNWLAKTNSNTISPLLYHSQNTTTPTLTVAPTSSDKPTGSTTASYTPTISSSPSPSPSVPEFPIWIILPLVMITVLLAVLSAKRKDARGVSYSSVIVCKFAMCNVLDNVRFILPFSNIRSRDYYLP